MPNMMAALPNIGDGRCSMSQFGWRPLLQCYQDAKPVEIWRGAQNSPTDLSR